MASPAKALVVAVKRRAGTDLWRQFARADDMPDFNLGSISRHRM
jgi:hypothetical protein